MDALLVSQYLIVNDMKYDYSFRAIMLMSLLILLVLTMLNRCGWVLHPKEKRKMVVVRGCKVRVIVDISVC